MRRGEVWVANLNPNRGGETGKSRPVVIFQEERITSAGLCTVIVLPLTTQFRPDFAPMRVKISARDRLLKDSFVMVEHVTALDRMRFGDGFLTMLTAQEMTDVEKRVKMVLGLV